MSVSGSRRAKNRKAESKKMDNGLSNIPAIINRPAETSTKAMNNENPSGTEDKRGI